MLEPLDLTSQKWGALLRIVRNWKLEWNLSQLLSSVAREAVESLGVERGLVLLLDTGGLTIKSVWPSPDKQIPKDEIPYNREVTEEVIQKGRAVYAHDMTEGSPQKLIQIFCVPLTASRGILGVLYLENSQDKKGLSQEDQEFLEMLGIQAASALEHSLLYHKAITDPLTGLYSHTHFQQEMDQALRRAQRSEKSLTLMMMDLDHFKQLNDTCGHQVGNQCLISVSKILQESLRSTDVIARFGGDEFEILLPASDLNNSRQIAEKIRAAIEELNFPNAKKVTTSIGLSVWPQNANDIQELFLRSDEALYEAKKMGRNQVFCSTKKSIPPKKVDPLIEELVPTEMDPNLLSGFRLPESPARPFQDTSRITKKHESKKEQVDGHEVVGRMGSGSSGEVLLVRQPELNRVVALKRPLTPHLTKEQEKAFVKEARVTGSLNHPGIIPVYTMGRDADGRRYYTMKPLHGKSLSDVLESRKKKDEMTLQQFSLNRLLDILMRGSEAIAYAHSQNLTHLDITPANIIVGEFGEVTIIDWGTGAHYSGGSSSDEGGDVLPRKRKKKFLMGSPVYTAPEHLTEQWDPFDTASDVFALGAVLYEILTGEPPFFRKTTSETLEALKKGELVAPDQKLSGHGIDPMLSSLCMQCLSLDPSERPSALEMVRGLGRYVLQESELEIESFSQREIPVKFEEWVPKREGKWELKNNTWISRSPAREHILFWKKPASGNFTFTCEAWVEKEGAELSIFGMGPDLNHSHRWKRREVYNGYCFQFGAEENSYTKLARHGQDILVRTDFRVELHRKYRLALAYEDGWLHCFIDGKLVFNYREFFPFPGKHIGFYTWGEGAFFKPLEIRKRPWGLKVPVLRMADQLYSHGVYQEALDRYEELHLAFPKRLEGQEALLKMGMCEGKLGDKARACEILQSLHGTQLESFAIAEEAMLELPPENFTSIILETTGDYAKAEKLFSDLFERFPESQARFQVQNVFNPSEILFGTNHILMNRPYEKDLEIRAKLLKLGQETLDPPANTQFHSHNSLIKILNKQGKWKRGFEEVMKFRNKLNPQFIKAKGQDNILLMVLLQNGREDLIREYFPDGPHKDFLVENCSYSLLRGEADELLLNILQSENWTKNTPLMFSAITAFLVTDQFDKIKDNYSISGKSNQILNHIIICHYQICEQIWGARNQDLISWVENYFEENELEVISKDPFKWGSFIRPFQPVVVRGFSK